MDGANFDGGGLGEILLQLSQTLELVMNNIGQSGAGVSVEDAPIEHRGSTRVIPCNHEMPTGPSFDDVSPIVPEEMPNRSPLCQTYLITQ